MTSVYKKRAKSGYNSDKKLSNKLERKVVSKEIEEQLSETSKLKTKVVKKTNKKSLKLKNDIEILRLAIKNSNGKGLNGLLEKSHDKNCTFLSSHYSSLYQKAKKSIPTLEQSLDNPEVSNKIKRQIKELLAKA